MAGKGGSLEAQLSLLAIKSKEKASKMIKVAVTEGFNIAAVKSPVGNPDLWVWWHPQKEEYVDFLLYRSPPAGYVGGQFRANWRLSLGNIDEVKKETTDYSGTVKDAVNALKAFNLGDVIYYSNPLPYAARLEYDAWSTQAPDGIARPAALAVKKALEAYNG